MSNIRVNVVDIFPADALAAMFPSMKFKIQDAVVTNRDMIYYCVTRHEEGVVVGYSVIVLHDGNGEIEVLYSKDFDFDKYTLTSIDFIMHAYGGMYAPLISYKDHDGIPYVSSDPETDEVARGILAKDANGLPVILDFIESNHYGVRTELRVKVSRPVVSVESTMPSVYFLDDGFGEYHRGDLLFEKEASAIYPRIEDYQYDVSLARSTFSVNRQFFNVGRALGKVEQLMLELEIDHGCAPPREGPYSVVNINPEHGFVLCAYRNGKYLAHNPDTEECGVITDADIEEHSGFYGKPMVTVKGTPYVAGQNFICIKPDGNIINLETFTKCHILDTEKQDILVSSNGELFTHLHSDNAFEFTDKKNVALKDGYH